MPDFGDDMPFFDAPVGGGALARPAGGKAATPQRFPADDTMG